MRVSALTFVAALILVTASWPRAVMAWGNKEHVQLTRIAAARLIADAKTPADMKAWLRDAVGAPMTLDQEREYLMKARVGLYPRGVDGLAYWAIVPDLVAMAEADRKVAPFDLPERALHYVDLEQLFDKPESRRRYAHDLSNRPSGFDLPYKLKDDRWKRAGALPLRVDQCYAQLVKSIKAKKLVDKPGQFPRDEHAARWAGYLAHYVQDNTQPHHATEDSSSRSYFADQRKAPNVHWDFSGRLSDDEEDDYPKLRAEFWTIFVKMLDLVEDPVDTDDPRLGTFDVALISYEALPFIGVAAMKAYGQKGTPTRPEGAIGKFDADKFFHASGVYHTRAMTLMELRARQMAWAVKRTERLWLQAWNEAAKAAKNTVPSAVAD
jgi:hypothetical protein